MGRIYKHMQLRKKCVQKFAVDAICKSLEMLEKVSCLAFFSGDACLSLKFGNQISLVDSIKVGI